MLIFISYVKLMNIDPCVPDDNFFLTTISGSTSYLHLKLFLFQRKMTLLVHQNSSQADMYWLSTLAPLLCTRQLWSILIARLFFYILICQISAWLEIYEMLTQHSYAYHFWHMLFGTGVCLVVQVHNAT